MLPIRPHTLSVLVQNALYPSRRDPSSTDTDKDNDAGTNINTDSTQHHHSNTRHIRPSSLVLMSRPIKRKPRATLLLFDPLNSPVKPVAPRKSPLSLSVFTEEEEEEEEQGEEGKEEQEATEGHPTQDLNAQSSLYTQIDHSLYSIYSDRSSHSSLSSLSLPSSHSGFLVDVGSPEKQGSLVGDLIGDFDDHEVSRVRHVEENEVDSLLMSLDSPVQPKTTDKPGPDRFALTETPVRAKHASLPSFDSPSTPCTAARPSRSAGQALAELGRTVIPDLVAATPVAVKNTRAPSPTLESTSEPPEPSPPSVQSVNPFSIPREQNECDLAPSSTQEILPSPEHIVSPSAINPWEIPLPSSPPSEVSFFLTAPDEPSSPPLSVEQVPRGPSPCFPSSDDTPKDESSFLLETPRPPTGSRAPSPSFLFDVTDTSFDLLADATLPEGFSMSTLRAPSPMLLAPQELNEGSSFIMNSPATSRSPAPKRSDGRAPSPFPDSSFDLLDESLPDIPPEASFALPPPTPRSEAPTPRAPTRRPQAFAALQSTPSQATPIASSRIRRNQPPSSSLASLSSLVPQAPAIVLSVPSPSKKHVHKDTSTEEGDTTLNLDDHFKNEDMSFCHLPGMSLELDGEDDRWDVSFADFAAQVGQKKPSGSKDLGASLAPSRLALATPQPDLLAASLPPPEEVVPNGQWDDVKFVHEKAQSKVDVSQPALSASVFSNSSASSASSSRTAIMAHPSTKRSILAPTNRQTLLSHQRTPSLPHESSRLLASSTKSIATNAQGTPRSIRKSPSVSSALDFQQTPRSSAQGSHSRSRSLAGQPYLDSPSQADTPVRSKPLPFSRLHVRLSAAASPRTPRDVPSERLGFGEKLERAQSMMKPSISTGSLAQEASDLPSGRPSSTLRSASGPSSLNLAQSARTSISTPTAPKRTARPVATPKPSLTPSVQPVSSHPPPPITLRPLGSASLVPSRSIPKPPIKTAGGAQTGPAAAGAPPKVHTIESIRAALANLEARRCKH